MTFAWWFLGFVPLRGLGTTRGGYSAGKLSWIPIQVAWTGEHSHSWSAMDELLAVCGIGNVRIGNTVFAQRLNINW